MADTPGQRPGPLARWWNALDKPQREGVGLGAILLFAVGLWTTLVVALHPTWYLFQTITAIACLAVIVVTAIGLALILPRSMAMRWVAVSGTALLLMLPIVITYRAVFPSIATAQNSATSPAPPGSTPFPWRLRTVQDTQEAQLRLAAKHLGRPVPWIDRFPSSAFLGRAFSGGLLFEPKPSKEPKQHIFLHASLDVPTSEFDVHPKRAPDVDESNENWVSWYLTPKHLDDSRFEISLSEYTIDNKGRHHVKTPEFVFHKVILVVRPTDK